MSVKLNRNSKYEMARIMCMFMIVINHSISHGIFENNNILALSFSNNVPFAYFITHFGDIGNAFFMLLTGFFCAKNKIDSINYKGILRLACQMEFYSMGIMILLIIFSAYQFQPKDILKSMFPFFFGLNWYFCCFIIIGFTLPLLAKIIYLLDISQLSGFVIFIFSLKFVFPLFGIKTYLPFQHDIYQFVLMVVIGGMIYRLVNECNMVLRVKRLVAFLIIQIAAILGLCFLIYIIYKLYKPNIGIRPDYFRLLFVNTIPINLLLLLCVLEKEEERKKLYNSKIVNRIAACVPGIYLIHDNRFLRSLLWEDNFTHFQDSSFYLYIFIKCSIIFVVCGAVELLRQVLFGKFEERICQILASKVETFVNQCKKNINRCIRKGNGNV